MKANCSLESIPDDELLRRLADLLRQSRRVECDLVAHIAEVDARRLYAREASPSMFVYCTDVLHLSAAEAYLRITVGRAIREHPVILVMLGEGLLHLTGIAKLAPHLTPANRDALLDRAVHKSKRQIEELLAEIAPRPDAPTAMRKLPERPPAQTPAPPPSSGRSADLGAIRAPELRPDAVVHQAPSPQPLAPAIAPLAPARYKVQFTASAELRHKLERLQALLRSEVPNGDLGAIIEQAVTEKLERLEARRYAKTRAPRKAPSRSDPAPTSRYIPAPVRRAVFERDEGRCRYVDRSGRRCSEQVRLEFHHRHPFAHGGNHRSENVALLCRAHNVHVAEQDYGRAAITSFRVQDLSHGVNRRNHD
ncbi:MAG TPA: HNH endonuclease signature motif containing protein [Vicinamibacteria bacterium]|nr:HNH endonuclease signature motif containing protein [Vicinamibacteria bacterium]